MELKGPMRFLSPLISDARGKLGGVVYSRNPYGVYVRAKTPPAQPRTALQQAGRSNFAALAAAWRALSPADRTAWRNYASQILRTDSLGRQSVPDGFHAYLTNSRFSQIVGSPFAAQPPEGPEETARLIIEGGAEVKGTAPFMSLFLTFVGFAFPPTGELVMQGSPPLSDTINFVPRQTYRNFPPEYTSTIFGADFAEGYLSRFPAPSVGQVIWLRIRAINRPSGIPGAVNQMRLVVT